jgi:hypothetical protein
MKPAAQRSELRNRYIAARSVEQRNCRRVQAAICEGCDLGQRRVKREAMSNEPAAAVLQHRDGQKDHDRRKGKRCQEGVGLSRGRILFFACFRKRLLQWLLAT